MQVSITGFVEHSARHSLLVVCSETGISIADYFCMEFSSMLKENSRAPNVFTGLMVKIVLEVAEVGAFS